jgi:DNA-binding FadR family transcriptional regulator
VSDRATSKHEQIAAGLINDILTGRYAVGERLPSERDLATRFEANRGSVREAMKRLEQIGLADVQPGGARVKNKEEASLDVIGHLLEQDELPDALLLDQIFVVISSLMTVAAEQVVAHANDAEVDLICDLAKPLYERDLDKEAHTLARFELMNQVFQASGNLPLNLIARTLFLQILPNMTEIHQYVTIDHEAYASTSKRFEAALRSRDVEAVRETFAAFSDLNNATMTRALAEARSGLTQRTQEAIR